ncbi:MAG: HEAT repeat domain-containing protein [Deltaproteobacteria bacterium]|nr:HEAT repeat domain-containing protein [Deltaproteobacteria bacterium]
MSGLDALDGIDWQALGVSPRRSREIVGAVRDLCSEDGDVRGTAIGLLDGLLVSPLVRAAAAVVPVLMDIAEHPFAEPARIYGWLGTALAGGLPKLREVDDLRTDKARARLAKKPVLMELHDAVHASLPSCMPALGDEAPEVRAMAIYLLGVGGSRAGELRPAMAERLSQEDRAELRAGAILALTFLGDARTALAGARELLSRAEDAASRAAAAVSAIHLGSRKEPGLLDALEAGAALPAWPWQLWLWQPLWMSCVEAMPKVAGKERQVAGLLAAIDAADENDHQAWMLRRGQAQGMLVSLKLKAFKNRWKDAVSLAELDQEQRALLGELAARGLGGTASYGLPQTAADLAAFLEA